MNRLLHVMKRMACGFQSVRGLHNLRAGPFDRIFDRHARCLPSRSFESCASLMAWRPTMPSVTSEPATFESTTIALGRGFRDGPDPSECAVQHETLMALESHERREFEQLPFGLLGYGLSAASICVVWVRLGALGKNSESPCTHSRHG